MPKSQNAFNKKQKEKKRQQKKQDKQQRKEERQANAQSGTLENMMAYVDEQGNILDSPPEKDDKKEKIDASEIEVSVPKSPHQPDLEHRGRVSFFDTSKGYGFINQDGTQQRYFIHANNLKMAVQEGDKVSFKTQKGLKGMEAIEVKILK
ncbi:cold-shock protein [Marinoscillum sp. MHG1-6]|uniref:cold-shock protein n=1 Tax=Marinoscillum sp. MHG1-6 TaxID=2959627 RepID=UPI002158808F|nr:cold shock domain-containing protein [Marinoscillum sp. MHG1-6]